MKKLLISISILITGVSVSFSQTKLPVIVEDYKIEKIGQNVEATISILNVKNGKNSYRVTASPVLSKGDNVVNMPTVVFRTTKGRILDFRDNMEYPKNTILAKRGESVEYSYLFSYKSWMDQSQLVVNIKSNGCCKDITFPIIIVGQNLNLKPDSAYIVKPSFAYQEPASQPKVRQESGSAYLEFPVGSSSLIGDFKNNAFELGKINNSIEIVTNDKANKTLNSIDIWGTCSPEGSYETNSKLAQNRAISVKNYITNNYPHATSNYNVTSTAENWSGLVDALKNNDEDWARRVVSIASSNVNDNTKDKQVKALKNGQTYKYLLKEVYPKLRRVDYKVNYVIRDFSINEVAKIFNSKPQDLSLKEMYDLANTYPISSPQFYNVIRSSATLYPSNNIALLNAATASIQNGNVNDAAQFLSKVKLDSKEYYNTLAVLQMLNGDYKKAKENFTKSYQMGLKNAAMNLKELGEKIKNNLILEKQK